ncbi:MAG: EthD family reductase [Dehalococcoidales bacterium]|nr:MAG: EthD family reductase [Dehalococcoidales bacterium]
MIRGSVMYPNDADKKFDMDYYLNKHMPMLHEKLDSVSLVKAEIDKGIQGQGEDSPPPYRVICHLYFNSMEDFHKIHPYEAELFADVPNYTDIVPVIQLSEIV